MTQEQRLKNMEVPQGIVDVVVDTDAYNELDDQFAIAYLLRAPERVRIRALMAAPFLNNRSTSPADGMRKSEAEIRKLLQLAGCDEMQEMVYSGSEDYLPDEKTPVESSAARRLVELSQSYTAENPLYIVALGAITNVASALLMDPTMKDRVVLSWLGGHALHAPHTGEFNMKQDIAAARVVFGSGIPLIQLPCVGCVDIFRVSGPELEHWLSEKNPLADYLCRNTVDEVSRHLGDTAWTRVIWDVTAAAWLLNDGDRFMDSKMIPAPVPGYDQQYSYDETQPIIRYVTMIKRDALMTDLMKRLAGQ